MCCQISSWLVNLYRTMYCKSQLHTAMLRHLSSLLRNSHMYCSAACHVCIARVRHNTVLTAFAMYHQGCRDVCATTSHCVMQNAQQLPVYRHTSLCLVGDMWPPCPCVLLEICGRHVASELAMYRHMSPRSTCIAMYRHSWQALAVYS